MRSDDEVAVQKPDNHGRVGACLFARRAKRKRQLSDPNSPFDSYRLVQRLSIHHPLKKSGNLTDRLSIA